MPILPFLEYRPDVSDHNQPYTQVLANVLPRADGYGPFNSIEEFTDALPADCRGYFVARLSSGAVEIFAGTQTKLYQLNKTTLAWGDVSQGSGTYAALDNDAHWSFAQFNNVVIATQNNDDVQKFDMSSDSEFADLGGSPPRAGWVAVINRFAVLGDLASNPFRVQWSGLNAITTWTSGVNNSDYQDLPDGGRLRAIGEASADVGLLFQVNAIRRMIFSPGSEIVFDIDRLATDRGIRAPWSLTMVNGVAYFLASRGFVSIDASGALTPIGEERTDRTFNAAHDPAELQLVIGASDPEKSLVMWTYKSLIGTDGRFDSALLYHTVLQRWSPITVSGEFIASISRPGITLEAIDAVTEEVQIISGAADNGGGLVRLTVGSSAAWSTNDYLTVSQVTGTTEANGTWQVTVINATTIDLQASSFSNAYVSGGIVSGYLDTLTFSLDSVSNADLPELSVMSTNAKLAFFTGSTLEATIETGEQSLDGWRMNINGLRPITDAPDVYAAVVARDNLNEAATTGDESAIDDDGFCPLLEEARFARAKLRIPAGTAWTFARGIEPDFQRGAQL